MDTEYIKARMLMKGVTQQDIAEKIGLSQQAVAGWFDRKNIPHKHRDLINSMLDSGVSLFNDAQVLDKTISIRTIDMEVGASINMDINNIDVITSGGNINIREDGLDYTAVENLVAIPVSGVSMLPTIMPNEYVIMDKGINRYIGDDLYVLNYDGNFLVKRIQFDPVTNSIDIISDNPQYSNYKLNLNEDQSHFHIIGKVVTTIRR